MWLKLVGGVVTPVALFGVVLFGLAGTFDWQRAWVLLGVVGALSAAMMVAVFARDPALLDERYKSPVQAGQPLADKIITPLVGLTFFAQLGFIPRDVFHYGLLGRPPIGVAAIGLALVAAGWLLIAAAFRANSFAAPIVKHQADRDQRVVDRGVYAIVRHPMYSAALLIYVGMPLWLGSYAAAVGAIVPMLPIVARLLVEESTLRRELPGYSDYASRVRWRLVPGIW